MTTAPSRSTISEPTMGWLSFLTLFVIGTDTFLTAPLLPLLRHEFHTSVQQSGWLVSAYALGYAASALVAGPISDHHDRRGLLLGGLAFFALFTATCGLAWNFESMLIFRGLAGVAAAFVTPQIWAAIPTVVTPSSILKTMGRATAGLAIAQVAGIPLGSFLSSLGWQLPFFTLGTASVCLWVLLAQMFPHVRPVSTTRSPLFASYRLVAASKPLRMSLLAYLIFQCGNFCALSFIGSWFARDFGATQSTIGFAMMAIGLGNALGSFTGAQATKRLGSKRAIGLGITTMGLMYATTAWVHNLWVAVPVLALAMCVGGMLFPVLMGEQQSHTHLARGTVSSVSNAAMYVGVTIGGAVGGPLLANQPGYRGIAEFTIGMFALALLTYGVGGTLRHPQATSL